MDLTALRARLLAQRAELEALADTATDASRTVELDQQSVGRLSRMDALQAQSMAQESERRRRQQLLVIATALRRIDQGSYGECLVCGEAIDTRRLAVNPGVTTCISCAERQ